MQQFTNVPLLGDRASRKAAYTGDKSMSFLTAPVTPPVGEVGLAKLLKELLSSHFRPEIGPAAVGDALGMTYFAQGTHGLEPSACEGGSKVAANGAEDTKDSQPEANHKKCNCVTSCQMC